ncbi:hypothetical protein KO481_16975 [Nocardia sp. NEAU-G5]|uniref:DUF222 domain-containing protein n=1 Tax=Nocardia albiluteola TaxID=2842303 RepID=A0ABS6AYT1_9NOCA|nr:hypothetical protein [Nocardia albiluteola]MBU3063215.1 hypothetical protein [Nocardia albiluteola]
MSDTSERRPRQTAHPAPPTTRNNRIQRGPNRHTETGPSPDPQHLAQVYTAVLEQLTADAITAAEPENNLAAALLTLTAPQAAQILTHITDTDLHGHLPATVVHLARQLATEGKDPTPQAIMARARDPHGTNPQPTFRQLVLYITTIHTMHMPINPWAAAHDVVEDAYRRSKSEHGLRTAQMADAHAPLADLDNHDHTATKKFATHRRRLAALHQHATHPHHLKTAA